MIFYWSTRGSENTQLVAQSLEEGKEKLLEKTPLASAKCRRVRNA